MATNDQPVTKDAPVPTVSLRKGVNAALLRIVDTLSDEAKVKEIEQLNSLSEQELSWENSSATIRALDGDIGPRRKRLTRPASPDDHNSNNEGIPAPDDNPAALPSSLRLPAVSPDSPQPLTSSRSDPPPPALCRLTKATTPLTSLSTPVPTSPQQPTNSDNHDSQRSVLPSDRLTEVPDWIREHRDRLVAIPMLEELQFIWKRIVSSWVLVEEALGFQTPIKGFIPDGRPREILIWIQNARRNSVVIKPDRYGGYTKDWFVWWERLNPAWRARENGRLRIDSAGDWSSMFRPGKCGFILVLECLHGLQEVAPVEDLVNSVKDVDWVLTGVLAALVAGYVVHLFVL
jgi:hypothetical protein